jgi:hypothetical protein
VLMRELLRDGGPSPRKLPVVVRNRNDIGPYNGQEIA